MEAINGYTKEKRKRNLEKLKTYDKEALVNCIINQSNSILKLTEQVLPENYEYHNRIVKAIDYLEELISDTKGMIDNYNNEDKEQTIKRFIEDLKTDLEHYKYLQLLLRGEKNE